jgi:hypothetical protein
MRPAEKLAVAESIPVVTGLLLVVARLVHLHLPDTLSCLASQPAPKGAHHHCERWPLEALTSGNST